MDGIEGGLKFSMNIHSTKSTEQTLRAFLALCYGLETQHEVTAILEPAAW